MNVVGKVDVKGLASHENPPSVASARPALIQGKCGFMDSEIHKVCKLLQRCANGRLLPCLWYVLKD